MQNPLISIVIPVYNGSNYLAKAIDSALEQTYENIEIIVVNDGSRDDGATERVALSYGDKIRYIKKENGGCSSALNKGIEEMKGEYFSWLSHDDMYAPEKIACQVALITEENKESLFMCASSFVDCNGEKLSRKVSIWGNKEYSAEQALSNMFEGLGISGCALLIPKALFDREGMFRNDVLYMQDYDMWYRFFLSGAPIVCCDTVGVLSRVHAMQTTVTGKSKAAGDVAIVCSEVVKKLHDKYGSENGLLKKYYFRCLRNRCYEAAALAKKLLAGDKALTISDKIKASTIKKYGKIRPFLVRMYYKISFGIKVKK